MRPEIINYLDYHPDYRHFIRLHPEWYTRLSRNPGDVQQIKDAADDFYGRSLTKKIEKFTQQLGMINMMMDLAMAAASEQTVTKGATD